MYGFKAFVFKGKRTAGKAFDTLEDHMPVYPWIDDAAVVSRSKLGISRIHSTWAQDDTAVGAGTGLGAVTGAVVGSVLGPAGAAAVRAPLRPAAAEESSPRWFRRKWPAAATPED